MPGKNKKLSLPVETIAELKKRVAALEASESRLRQEKESLESLVANSLDCIVLSDRKGIIIDVNRAFTEMTGFKKEEILGKTPRILVPDSPGEYESVTGVKVLLDKKFFDLQKTLFLEELFEKGFINKLKTAVLRRDGKLVPVEENIFLLYNKKGAVTGSAAIIHEVTQRKRTEEELKNHRDHLDVLVKEQTRELRERESQLNEVNARLVANEKKLKAANEQLSASNQQLTASESSLRESEKNFRRLVETMNEGLMVMDVGGGLSYVNEKLCIVTGYGKKELEGGSFEKFVDTEDERSRIAVDNVLSSGNFAGSGSREIILIKKDGKRIPVIISPETIVDEKSGFLGTFAVVTDITELKRAENSVRESRDFLENIFKATRDGIIITDVTGAILRVNRSVERIFGFTVAELVGTSMTHYMPEGEKYRIVGRGFAEELKSKGFVDIFEAYFKKKNGEIAPFECNISLLKDESGTPTGAVVLLRDIAERKKMEQQFLQTEKLSSLGELAGGVAHDFNNVLSAILGRAQLLMRRINKLGTDKSADKLMSEISESLKVIEKASLDGADTVHRIMKFARKEKEQDFVGVDLHDVIDDAIEFTRPKWKGQAEAKGIIINILKDFSASAPYVSGNASELREVITNILSNAFDAMPAGGDVWIKSRIEGGWVFVEIADSGGGIKEDILDKIFDPFFTTKGPKSTGLGMSVSYGIIDQHGGNISVRSAQGEKTVFTVSLPLDQSPVVETHGKKPAPVQKKMGILLIEDEKSVCDVLKEMLTGEGHAVTVAYDGKQGLALFAQNRFDLVITDLAMPGMSGWQVAKAIKTTDNKVPVILTTGWELKPAEGDANRKYVDIIVNKPFTVSRISEVITAVFKSTADGPLNN